jgi:predicted RND superfamily exporter protein
MNRFIERFVSFLILWRWPLFCLAVVIAAAAWYPSRFVRFDRSIEKLFAPNDPLLPPYQRLKQQFGGNEVIIAVYHDPHLLDPAGEGIQRLEEVSRRIETVPGIYDVLSLARVNHLLEQLEKGKNLGGALDLFRKAPAPSVPAILNPDSQLARQYRTLFAGYTHSADGKNAAVVCMLKPTSADAALNVPRELTIAGLEKVMQELPDGLTPGVLAGEPVMVAQGFALLERDGRKLATWTLVLLGITVLIFFRSLRWLVVPLLVVEWTLIMTRASLVLTGGQLSMVSSMLTAIVTVVGVAGVMHVIVEIRELRTHGLGQRDSLRTAGILLAGPILGAVLTDASGFGSLWWASVEPVRDFGTMMVIGSLLVLPAICLLVPALALVFADDRPMRPAWGEEQIGHWLMRSVEAVHARPKTVAAISVVVAILVSLGAIRLEIETDFTRNFRRDNQIVSAYNFVEAELGGAGVWDVTIPAPPALDAPYLRRVRRLEERLRAIRMPDRAEGNGQPGLTKVLSLADALDAIEVDPILSALPLTAEQRYQGMAAAMPVFMKALRYTKPEGDSSGRLRIMLRARERQPAEQKRWLINEVSRIARQEFSNEAEVTGFFVLLTNLIESILRDQWITFAVSSIAILAMVWIGFRSWRYALISMIPNAVPIYMVMGLLGWVGLKMNMGAAMIAAVSMGMSVDSSIHYFSAFRRARREGKTVHAALVQCQQSVGLAMIFSTIALIIGFGVLVTSDFVPTIYFGALMSLAMLGGMLGNLIVLPLLLSWTERDSDRRD